MKSHFFRVKRNVHTTQNRESAMYFLSHAHGTKRNPVEPDDDHAFTVQFPQNTSNQSVEPFALLGILVVNTRRDGARIRGPVDVAVLPVLVARNLTPEAKSMIDAGEAELDVVVLVLKH
ncbi:hypothetical protein NX059_000219 [Plenodomus lindquistii]|nr:hypothetical protein NX059_000219 [Plenodomus lindquistii]